MQSKLKKKFPYPKCKLSRIVVHSTGVHQGQSVPDGCRIEDFLSGHGTDSTIGQGSSNDGGGLTSHLDRAELQGRHKTDALLPEDGGHYGHSV